MTWTLKTTLPTTAAAVLLLCSSAPTQADDKQLLSDDCRVCVYDKNDTPVGLLNGNSYLLRPVNNRWFYLYYDSTGLEIQDFYFTSSDCSGQKYIAVGALAPRTNALALYLPQPAIFDGVDIWIPTGSPALIKIGSVGPGPGTQCGTYGSGGDSSIVAQAAEIGDTTVFAPPFTVKQLPRKDQ